VIVVCGEPVFDPPQPQLNLPNPRVLIEVSSASSETDDRGEKFYDYMSIDLLQEYMIVVQDKIRVDTFYRQSDGIWTIGPSATTIEASVTFRSLSVNVPVAEIYAGVQLPLRTDAKPDASRE
jgi:Uma2 family endonuclease